VTLSATALLAGPATLTLAGVGSLACDQMGGALARGRYADPLGTEAGEYNGIAVMPGFRLPYRTWSLDIGVIRALDTDDPDPPVIPFIAFTLRFLP
jgi:hypothetical protein